VRFRCGGCGKVLSSEEVIILSEFGKMQFWCEKCYLKFFEGKKD